MAFTLTRTRSDEFAGSDRKARHKPEEQELGRKREEQASLEMELAARELQLANLLAELAVFERRYLRLVAARYAELDEWKARSGEGLAQERPESESPRPPAAQARARVTGAAEPLGAWGEDDNSELHISHPSPGIKRLYREVARRIHPDLAFDRADRARRERLMAEANLAYERDDEAKLETILAAYESSPEAVAGEGPGAELIRAIRKVSRIRTRIAEIEAELQELWDSDLYQLKRCIEGAQQSGRDLIWEIVARVEEQIVLAKERAPGQTLFASW